MNNKEFFDQLHISLTDQQKEAVLQTGGPVLLLAVPGSGKTTTLVTRLGHMIHCDGIDPAHILVVTYTVAATKDMRERFARFFGPEIAESVEFRTINGICSIIIRYYENLIGKSAFQLENDEKKIARMLSDLYRKVKGEYPTESDVQEIRTKITYIKNMMLTPEEIKKLNSDCDYNIAEIYERYRQLLREQCLMDYDDQMVYALHMLRKSPETLSHFQDRFQYLCVDEAQDTSKIQHTILALLASRDKNIFMVGDEDQSIYGFRAAYPQALLDFEKTYPDAKVLLMEENFRSDEHIVNVADQFIQKNTMRHKKTMHATRKSVFNIQCHDVYKRDAQYSYLLKVADHCTQETAVLYRDNESIIPVVDLLERARIPYRIKNADLTFFTHRTVVDISNIIKFAHDQTNAELFMQIYYKISTYFRKNDALIYTNMAAKDGREPLAIAMEQSEDKREQSRLRGLRVALRKIMQPVNAREAMILILKDLGYLNYLRRSGLSESKIPILRALADQEESARSFLNRLNELRQIIATHESDPDCPFILSTIHSSKGLEYDSVYLMDVMDGVFPATVPEQPALATKEEKTLYEEERRLFYVGVTRAKNHLHVFRASHKTTFVNDLLNKKDPAVEKAKTELKEGMMKRHVPYQGTLSLKNGVTQKELEKYASELKANRIVKHSTYGIGEVIGASDQWVVISFKDIGMKTFSTKTLMQGNLISQPTNTEEAI